MAQTDQKDFAKQLSALLVKQQSISQVEGEHLQTEFEKSSHDWFVEFLLEEGLVEKSDILRALSTHYQVPAFDANGFFFDHMLVRDFPKDFLLRNSIIPVEIDQDILMIVAADPSREDLLPLLGQYTADDIEFYVGIKRDIDDAIKEYYDASLTDDYDLVEDLESEDEEREELEEAESEGEEE